MKKAITTAKYYFSNIEKQKERYSVEKLCAREWETIDYNRSESCTQNTKILLSQVPQEKKYAYESAPQNIILISTSSAIAVDTGIITNGFNEQTTRYVKTVQSEQAILNQQTQVFLQKQAENGVERTATNLRNKSNWMNVKRLVVREELMKLQLGGKTELPLSKSDIVRLKNEIADKKLSDMSDKDLQRLIDSILKPDPKQILQALKDYKENGAISPYFQKAKLQALMDELKDVDLDKITAKQLKHLIDNYWEKPEIHHRTSISSDETKQSNIDNLDTLKTSDHDKKHSYINEDGQEKVDYKRPVNEKERNRIGELEKLNKKRVLKNEVKGLGITLLVAGGVGFSVGFVVQLAQGGLNPNSMKYAFIAGANSGVDSMIVAGGSYVLSRTIGMKASEVLLDEIIDKFGTHISGAVLNNVVSAVSMGVSGSISIMVSMIYQFTKLKIQGYSTKESLLRIGRSAKISFTILGMSVIAQGIWGGHIGMVVSITAGVIMTGSQITMIIHDKGIREKVAIYLVKLCEPNADKSMRDFVYA